MKKVEKKEVPDEKKEVPLKDGNGKAREPQKSQFDHILSSQAGYIDGLLAEGTTVETALKAMQKNWPDIKAGRIKGHIHHLKKQHRLAVEEKEGIFKIK
jgi:hypothetical protein